MEQTTHYQLNQWAASDRIQREDFNADNAKIDAALAGLDAAVATLGNCRVQYSTYAGTGSYGQGAPSSLTFPEEPLLVIIAGYAGNCLFLYRGQGQVSVNGSYLYCTWAGDGKSVSWYTNSSAGNQFNNAATYRVLTVYGKE